MKTNLQIAWRFITSRKRSITMGLLGIVFGVGFFVVTQAQTLGFQNLFKQTIIGTNGAMRIAEHFQSTPKSISVKLEDSEAFSIPLREGKKYINGIEYPQLLREQLQGFSNISAISEIVEGTVLVDSGFKSDQPARIMGIRFDDHVQASSLTEQITLGDIKDFQADSATALIGTRLARRLSVSVGDYITISIRTEKNAYRVVAITETGIDEIDRHRIYLNLSEARSLLDIPVSDTVFQISLFNPDKALLLAEHIKASFKHNAVSWQEREKVNFDTFKAVRISAAITVSSIILISGLGIFNTLAMMVIEKTKEIAILRSMGYTQRDIAHIFLFQGGIIFGAGTILGWIFAVALTFGVSKIPIRIHGIFSADSFVVSWNLSHYIVASVLAAIVVFIASYIPARRAAKLEPGDIVRGTSG